MNRHFSDAGYYFRRGFEHLYTGLEEESEPLRRRALRALGREPETEEAAEPETPRERVEYGARRVATRGRKAAGRVRRRVRRTGQ